MTLDPNLPPEQLPAPGPAPVPAPAPEPRRGRHVVCEYCECELDAEGMILRRGNRAKQLLKLEQQIEDLTAARDRAVQEAAELKTQLAAAQPAKRDRDFSPF